MNNVIAMILALLALISGIVLAGDADFRADIGRDLQDLSESIAHWLGAIFRSSGPERAAELNRATRQGDSAVSRLVDDLFELNSRIWDYLLTSLNAIWYVVQYSVRG